MFSSEHATGSGEMQPCTLLFRRPQLSLELDALQRVSKVARKNLSRPMVRGSFTIGCIGARAYTSSSPQNFCCKPSHGVSVACGLVKPRLCDSTLDVAVESGTCWNVFIASMLDEGARRLRSTSVPDGSRCTSRSSQNHDVASRA